MWFAGIWTILASCPAFCLVAQIQRSRRFQAQTVADVLGIRFDSGRQVTAGIAMIIPCLFILSASSAAATCWYAITGFSPFTCLLFSIIVVIIYMLIGGHTGTQWAMGTRISGGAACLALGLWALNLVGGPGGLSKMLSAQDANLLSLIRPTCPRWETPVVLSMVGITSTFFSSLRWPPGFLMSRPASGMRKLNKKDYIN